MSWREPFRPIAQRLRRAARTNEFRIGRSAAPVPPIVRRVSEAEAYWAIKGKLLDRIRERINEDVVSPYKPEPNGGLTRVAPVIDLSARRLPRYGWVPAGRASKWTPAAALISRGTTMSFTGGDQEECPGGPGENLLFFEIEPNGTSPSGQITIPYDLRWNFGENLAEFVLVRADEPVLHDRSRLDAIAADVRRLIDETHRIAFVWTDADGRSHGRRDQPADDQPCSLRHPGWREGQEYGQSTRLAGAWAVSNGGQFLRHVDHEGRTFDASTTMPAGAVFRYLGTSYWHLEYEEVANHIIQILDLGPGIAPDESVDPAVGHLPVVGDCYEFSEALDAVGSSPLWANALLRVRPRSRE